MLLEHPPPRAMMPTPPLMLVVDLHRVGKSEVAEDAVYARVRAVYRHQIGVVVLAYVV